jgi:hypothetical protein
VGAGSIRVLVACEYSAIVRDAFRARGFDAWSCDLLPTEGDPQWHIQGDAIAAAYTLGPWHLLIAHPPCTHLAVSGARHFPEKRADGRQADALQFVEDLLDAPALHIALENPVSIISSHIRKPDQTIQPWQFGHGETKATCLWLKNLPKLVPTHTEKPDLFAAAAPAEREARIHKMPPGPNRWKERSRTFPGIAAAMAEQWGDTLSHTKRREPRFKPPPVRKATRTRAALTPCAMRALRLPVSTPWLAAAFLPPCNMTGACNR